jgi:hypothetical protein
MSLGIEFAKTKPGFQFDSSLFEHRRETSARPAPWRPAIHQHRHIVAIEYGAYIRRRQFQRLAGKQGLFAFSTLWSVAQPI